MLPHPASAFYLPGMVLCLAFAAALHAGESLHEKVDALIDAKAAGQAKSPPADDAEFLRRVWLDFDGGIPTAVEARAFLHDTSPAKRAALVAKLIAAPRFAERMADAFNVMLMERRGENPAWRKWLAESFRENKPWDAMVREILAPDFVDEKLRGAGWFITRRLEKVGQQDTDYPGLTRDVGRMFMGVDLQCCQCHRHLTVDQYKQADFSGLFAVYSNLKLQSADATRKVSWVSEGAMAAKYEFASVFTGVKGQVGPRIPFGEEVSVPAYKGDEAWLVKPDRKTKELGTPKFSPLKEIAQRLPMPENGLFAKNIANRVWFLMMGRGLVEPLDLQHADNPPTHPELLELLANELATHRFDLKWLISELAQSQTYARSSTMPEGATAVKDDLCLTARERHLTCEQQMRAFLVATGEFERLSKNAKADANDDARKFTFADFEKAFNVAFANPPKEAELRANPTLRSSLFFRNSDHVQWALQAREGNLVERVTKQGDVGTMAEELYLSALSRMPDTEEKNIFAEWMSRNGADKQKAVCDFAWALLSSTEWFVNH
jgi:hypothetical protein